MTAAIEKAVAAMGEGPLNESAILKFIAPLFSRVLANERVYLANHSLGRPLDIMAEDIAEATSLWYSEMGHAWEPWLVEREAFRARIAKLIHAPRVDCVVPKTSAGHGLRTVLNALPGKPKVISTSGEFDSVDVVLKQYAALGRIEVLWVEADPQGVFHIDALIEAVRAGADLVAISQVMFMTGQILHDIDKVAKACHTHGAKLLVDSYHAIGVIPVDVERMGADFMIGGSYKYLRGGPGACFLYLSPQVLSSGLRPLDTGWFANADEFAYRRSNPPMLKEGGDTFLESTPPVLTYYQARSGQAFLLAIGVERLREYSQRQLRALRGYLKSEGVTEMVGGDDDHGAFLAIRIENAKDFAKRMEEEGIVCDARSEWLRLCPDCLTRDAELRRAAKAVGKLLRDLR
ncbi:kynureninase [Silvibacterium bohemicum]|uniref:Kynureninase n=1 Tax=Silvibacterium bohemicum TaxID=1577686 RepID=A0A841K4H9_9BACT|nr:aminotransferase class V-fold PLP-dependent enzyme [Silvibacterium bohemicum]MBB6145164.1 kynureninase [Silvibacterium bohemicum]